MKLCQDLLQGLEIWDSESTWTVFSPDLYNSLHTKAINCCGTVRPNQKGMPGGFGRKLGLK
jgi:hypothetical protein